MRGIRPVVQHRQIGQGQPQRGTRVVDGQLVLKIAAVPIGPLQVHRHRRVRVGRSKDGDVSRHIPTGVFVQIVGSVFRRAQIGTGAIASARGSLPVPDVVKIVRKLLPGHRCPLRPEMTSLFQAR